LNVFSSASNLLGINLLWLTLIPGAGAGQVPDGDDPAAARVEAVPAKPLTGRKPLVVTLKPTATLDAQIQQRGAATTKDDDPNAPGIRLTVQGVTPPKPLDVGIRVFLNKSDADRTTPFDDPSYVTSLAFDHSHGEGEAVKPQTFVADLGPTLRKLQKSSRLAANKPLTVTLVAVPIHPRDSIEDREMPIEKVIVASSPSKQD
jgi:hypothetical protein